MQIIVAGRLLKAASSTSFLLSVVPLLYGRIALPVHEVPGAGTEVGAVFLAVRPVQGLERFGFLPAKDVFFGFLPPDSNGFLLLVRDGATTLGRCNPYRTLLRHRNPRCDERVPVD